MVVNIVGKTIEDYCELARRLTGQPGVCALELNVSCPNVKEGLQFGLDPQASFDLVKAVREATDCPLIAKLTPNVTDIGEQAVAVEEAGADAISLINTLLGMAIDWRSRRSRLARPMGGLSGPAIRPVALRMVYQAAQACQIPVCAIGGVSKPEDVLDFAVVGASLVQVGTHLYGDPACLLRWLDEIRALLESEGVRRFRNLVGTFDG